MPSLSFFADEQDAINLIAWLNADPEIAFIVPDGPLDPQEAYAARLQASMGERTEAVFYPPFSMMVDDGYRQRWKAVHTVNHLKDGSHSLWHVPAGSLPLLTEDGEDQVIADPWSGWTEQRSGGDSSTPYFATHPAEIRLELWTRHWPYSQEEQTSLSMLHSWWTEGADLLVVSDLEWIGDYYGPAPRQTWQWWERLEAWVARNAVRISYFPGEDEDTGEERPQSFWAFPSALQKLKSGMAYYARGWELDEDIHAAQDPAS